MDAFQDLIQGNHCFGCGPTNSDGLQIKSYWEQSDPSTERAICDFTPKPFHNAGMTHFLNGGIIASVMDCHAICTAMADGYLREGRPVGTGDTIWYVTGKLNVNYLKPVPIDQVSRFIMTIERREGKKTWLSGALNINNGTLATAEILAIRVPESWLLQGIDDG